MRRLVVFMLVRYLRFDKTQPFISITGILAFVGVGIGVMVLLVAMGIMNGMSEEFRKRLFVMNYPITIFAATSKGIDPEMNAFLESKLRDMRFSPYIREQAIIRHKNQVFPIMLYGVDMDKERDVNEIVSKYSSGLMFSHEYPLLVGGGVMNSLSLKKGDRVMLMFSNMVPTGIALVPTIKSFEIASHFSSGLNSYDNSVAYTSIQALSRIRRSGRYDGIHVFSDNSSGDISIVENAITEYERSTNSRQARVQGWWEQNASLFSAMELEKQALFIVLMLIILMASLNIVSSLLMVVMNRRKEIALLITLGASKREIKRIFFFLGMTVGGGGIVFGVVGGLAVMEALKAFPIIKLPADVYGTSELPINLLVSDFLGTVIGAVVIVCLSSLYPANKASKVDALQVLRNE